MPRHVVIADSDTDRTSHISRFAINPTAQLFRTEQVRAVLRDAGIPAEHLDASSYFSQDAEAHEEAYGGGWHPIEGPEAGLG
jgi:hypothetical protein